ncbi:M13 family metallopeptidase [Croceibacter atlanticus]|jgi:putative endopeptidase|uniref:Peptidase, M13 family (Lipoprotein) n=1 Tax=Croceibacter atlanticus (strain ATCC BAA-628 / JCM 21780 / CIP 108009 / IAM 15332 / KCTC 12090 / HTCC2559) TaxID=216432 RepID=A3U6K8_CROAH|nr:M13 family metallopeptidase [Croceibacter atlanticus]EAP87875.1 Peptidase, M13 family (lipoprotein) [Croceibacter atlanticus HTCC2559]MBW4969895.1 M13 family metallopeptidase [Croceibacter atlanticus]HAT69582.1 M13 family peptidase [Flavobacteriaceae bacterium]
MKTYFKTFLLSTCAVALVTVSCKDNKDVAKADEGEHGIILSNMDTTVNPKDDFYNYVNGNWMKNTEIPDDQSRWGGFGVLRKSTDKNVLNILAEAKESGKYDASTDQAKALAIFESELDTVARDEAGIKPLQPALKLIENINSTEDFQKVITEEAVLVAQPFFGLAAFSNPNNSSINSAYLTPGSLGLPDRDYYTNTDSKSKEIRLEYVNHITRMLQFLGDSEEEARKQAETILKLETELATPRLDKVASRDFRNFNNPRSISEVQKMVPAISWEEALKDMGVEKDVDTLIVMQPKYMEVVQQKLNTGNIDEWKTLLRWATLNTSAGYLTTEIEKANWDFYSKYLNETKKQRPADERALATVNNTVGEAVGKLYVEKQFPPEAKAKAEKMIANIIEAYQERIEKLEWMSDSTKTKAIEKLDKFTVKIGYPDEWEDYSTMEVSSDKSYYDNMVAVAAWQIKDNLDRINEPVDRKEWGMSPQTVNAYFNPFNNEIVFPAAILQPPFYDYKADEAVNYGGIGAVIGHEISHAFDDSGSRFDAEGNLVNWWSKEDLDKFTERGNALAEQYSQVEVLDSVYINGKFTLGENIGDLGGLLGAYDGLQKYYEENGRPENIDGFTPEQRFFMSWATVWRTKQRDEALRSQIKTDPHSPGRYRATQPLLNVDAFYKAFDIKEGDAMYLEPEKRVRIW